MSTTKNYAIPPKKTALPAYFLSELILGLFISLEGPALPYLAENTRSSLDRISLFFVLGSLGYMLGSVLGGRAYDCLRGHRLMAISLVVVAAAGSLIPLICFLWLLLLAQFILGLAQGVIDVGCNTLLLWQQGKDAGPSMNGLHFFFGLGTLVSPLVLAGVLSQTGGIHWAFWACAGLCLPLAVWVWHLPNALPQKHPNEDKKTGEIFAPLTLLFMAFLLVVGAEFGFGNWIYTYTLEMGLGTAVTSALLTAAFWGAFTFSRLIGIWLSTRLKPTTILNLDLLGSLVSLSLVAIWPQSRIGLWLGTIGTGLFMASLFPTLLVLVGQRLQVTGAVTGSMLVGGGVGGMLLPWLIGQAIVQVGLITMPLIVSGTIIVNLGMVMLLNARTKDFAA